MLGGANHRWKEGHVYRGSPELLFLLLQETSYREGKELSVAEGGVIVCAPRSYLRGGMPLCVPTMTHVLAATYPRFTPLHVSSILIQFYFKINTSGYSGCVWVDDCIDQ
jgi:hypothetical protein